MNIARLFAAGGGGTKKVRFYTRPFIGSPDEIWVYEETATGFSRVAIIDTGNRAALDTSSYDFDITADGSYLVTGNTFDGNNPDGSTRAGIIVKDPNGSPSVLFTAVSRTSTYATAFSPDGTYLALGSVTSANYINVYKRSGDTFTQLSNPTQPPSTVLGAAFSSDSLYLALAHQSSPFVAIYKRSGDTFTKLPNPATLPAGEANDVCFSPDTTFLAVAHDASPRVTIYQRSGDTFTKVANPATLPTGDAYSVSFDPTGVYLVVGHQASPFMTIYKRSGSTFTKLANPASLPSGPVFDGKFTASGDYLICVVDNANTLAIYKRSGDTFTRVTNPSPLPPATAFKLAVFPKVI